MPARFCRMTFEQKEGMVGVVVLGLMPMFIILSLAYIGGLL